MPSLRLSEPSTPLSALESASIYPLMSLTGSRIGPYEIGALIGAGGMGEVCSLRRSAFGR